MKLSNDDFILYEVFKTLYVPGHIISQQHLFMRTMKTMGVRIGLDSVKKFFIQMQEQGYGKYTMIDTKNPRFKDRNYGFICK